MPMQRPSAQRIVEWTRRRLPRLLAELMVVLVVLWAVEWWMTRDAVRGPAPAIAAATLSGTPVDPQSLGGEPALIYFWASWCPVCQAEQGAIDALAADYRVIGVAMQSGSDDDVRRFIADQGITFDTVNDPDALVARRYGVKGVPAAFVLDPAGNVHFVTRGYTTGLGLRLRLWLAGLM